MADFKINPVTVTPTETFKLGDMLNMARGAQAYRQAEQMNPLALQKAQEEVKQAQFGTNDAQLKNMLGHTNNAIQGIQTLLTDKDLSVDKVKDHVKELITNSGGTESAVKQALIGLPEKGTQSELRAYLAKKLATATSSQVQLEKMYPSATNIDTGSQLIPTQMGNERLTGVQPGTSAGPAITKEMGPGVIEVNGIKYKLDAKTQNLVPVSAAPAVVNASGAGGAVGVGGQVKPSSLVVQDMPVPAGGIPQMNTQQTARFEEGQKIQAESTSLALAAQEAKQTSRKIKENIAAASGSAPGQALRFAEKYIAGNETLDELVKNLADNQMRQAALMGASQSTDQARQVVAMANGSENITPQALAQIVQRADATSTALEKFNTGLNKYYENAGSYNGPIHARNFKQAWASNYDPRIFMVQNINSSDMSGAEKQIQLQAVLKGTTEQERKTLAKKAETIKRLERGDF